jgi:putative phosphoribosyl transferase
MSVSITNKVTRAVSIGPLALEGRLCVPKEAKGLVIFAHGSGSSRLSPRNTFVAERLQKAGLATLLFDLLTEDEARDRANVFDIPLLAKRVESAVKWAREQPETAALPIGIFGASTGAAAALVAAASAPNDVSVVVSRGGRPDLADAVLDQVQAATMLIVGGNDEVVLDLNRRALTNLGSEKELAIVPNATHLFEEPGALEEVVGLAAGWFETHFEGRSP